MCVHKCVWYVCMHVQVRVFVRAVNACVIMYVHACVCMCMAYVCASVCVAV